MTSRSLDTHRPGGRNDERTTGGVTELFFGERHLRLRPGVARKARSGADGGAEHEQNVLLGPKGLKGRDEDEDPDENRIGGVKAAPGALETWQSKREERPLRAAR